MKLLCNETWTKRKTRPKPSQTGKQLRIVDLFCGCGGLSLGASEAARTNKRRFKIVLAVDFDQTALDVYRANFGLSAKVARHEDIRVLFSNRLVSPLTPNERKLRRQCGKVDLIVAGPPCQGHSDLNNSSRRKDPRNSLYLRVVRAAKVLCSKVVIVENVPAVVHDKGRVVERAIRAFEELGFQVSTAMISAAALGLAQTRRRHILIAVRGSKFEFSSILDQNWGTATVRDYIGDLVRLNGVKMPIFDEPSTMTKKNEARARFLYKNGLYNLPNHKRPVCHHEEHSYVSMYGRLRWNKPAQTITSGFGSMGQGRFLHPSKHRTLTPHEAARIQGFPDFFRFDRASSRTALHTTIGNAVPPKLSAAFVDQLFKIGIL